MTGSHDPAYKFGRVRKRSFTASSTRGFSTLHSVALSVVAVIGSCSSQPLLFTCTLSSSITTSLGIYPCWSGSHTSCVIPFNGYFCYLAPTDRISVRHSEWSSSAQRPCCFSMHTHTHTHILLFYSYHMYLKSERERDRVSEANSAFTEEHQGLKV
jgi:hypothetical protein